MVISTYWKKEEKMDDLVRQQRDEDAAQISASSFDKKIFTIRFELRFLY